MSTSAAILDHVPHPEELVGRGEERLGHGLAPNQLADGTLVDVVGKPGTRQLPDASSYGQKAREVHVLVDHQRHVHVGPHQVLDGVARDDVRRSDDVSGVLPERVHFSGDPPPPAANDWRVVHMVAVAQDVTRSAPRDLAQEVHEQRQVEERVLVQLHHVTRARAVGGAPLHHDGHLEAQVLIGFDEVRHHHVPVLLRLFHQRVGAMGRSEEEDQLDDGGEVPAVSRPRFAVHGAGPRLADRRTLSSVEVYGRDDEQQERAGVRTLEAWSNIRGKKLLTTLRRATKKEALIWTAAKSSGGKS